MKNEGSTAPFKIFPDGEHPFYIQHLLGYPGDCSGWREPRMLSKVLGEVKSLGRLVQAQPTHSEGIQPQEQPGSEPPGKNPVSHRSPPECRALAASLLPNNPSGVFEPARRFSPAGSDPFGFPSVSQQRGNDGKQGEPGTGGQAAGPGRRLVTGMRCRDSGAAARDASTTPSRQTGFIASYCLITGHQ